MTLLLFGAGLVVAGVAWGVRARRRTRRQRALVRLCVDTGLEFAVSDPFPDTLFLPFRLFGRGSARGVDIVVWDRGDAGALRVFGYWYEEATDAGQVRASMTCGIVPLPFSVPPLTVCPRGFADPSGEVVPGVAVSLELEAFNRRFAVTAIEARAAVAFLDQRMMGALLALPVDVAIHVREDRMLLVARSMEPEKTLLLLELARGLQRRVPRVMASLYPPRPAEGPFEDRWLQGAWSSDPTSSEANRRPSGAE
ncbi:MAG: hypothetical protein ABJB55_05150 [Actinomycetota bacterium]